MNNKTLYFTLTSLIVGGVLFASTIIRVPIPDSSYYYNTARIDGSFDVFDVDKHLAHYDSLKIEIRTQQFRFSEYYQNADSIQQQKILDQARDYIFYTLKDQVIPFWYATEWDFNGTTETPRQGTIACGYFVTTVLRHSGFHIDKYLLSRKASKALIENTCSYQSIQIFRDYDFKGLLEHLEKLQDGIYILGLDSHVGLLVKSGGKTQFIHSRKPKTVGVIQEKASESRTIESSSIHVIGDLLNNDDFIQNWLQPV
ncbi:MAG: hypothetical protein NW226_09960 [Microscillaceae bacterium]|nr:hypothetical protein [Microscillaceae bacterium]